MRAHSKETRSDSDVVSFSAASGAVLNGVCISEDIPDSYPVLRNMPIGTVLNEYREEYLESRIEVERTKSRHCLPEEHP